MHPHWDATIQALPCGASATAGRLWVETGPYYTRLIIAPVPSWRRLGLAHLLGTAWFMLIALFAAYTAVTAPDVAGRILSIAFAALPASFAVWFFVAWSDHLRRWLVVDVTFQVVTVSYLSRLFGSRMTTWHRNDIQRVRASTATGNLLIHAARGRHGRYFLDTDPVLIERVGRALDEAFNRPTNTVGANRHVAVPCRDEL